MNQFEIARDYIKDAIREINPRIKEHNQPHTADNIGSFRWDQSYFVRFNSVTPSPGNGWLAFPLSIDIEFGAKAGVNPVKSHDDIMCDALNLSMKLVEKTRYRTKFNQVEINSITPDSVEGNERWTRVTLSVTINIIFEAR